MTMAANTTSPINGAAVKYWVTATVSEPMVLTFLQAMGIRSTIVGATATGGVVQTGGGADGCIYVLDHSAAQELWLNGASLSVTCGVYLNSNQTTNALQLNSAAGTLNAASLNMLTGAKIDCVGCGCETDSYYGTQNPSNTDQCIDPTYGTAVADPLASLPAISPAGCTATNYSWGNANPPQTLNPGTYCGGIRITGGNVTFNPGTYVLNGGGLYIANTSTTVSGSGVLFYNTASGYTAGQLVMTAQPTVTFTSQTTGTYQGILFMQDHNVCPSTSHQINGQANVKFNGTIYLHCTSSSYVAQNLLYTGQSSTGYYSAIVADTLTINGLANLTLDPTGGQNTGIGLGNTKPFLIQ